MGHTVSPKQFAEFFAGIGLVHEALKCSGWKCIYANDIDPKKEAMYKGHFGPSPYFHREDVWETGKIVEEMEARPFLATAPFPCTDLSLAGHWQGFEGDHSSTYFGFIRVLHELSDHKPKLVMLENVAGFLTSKDSDFVRAISALAAEGYWIDCIALDAKFFVPQSRPRVFVIGFHESLQSERIVRQRRDDVFDRWQLAIDEGGKVRSPILLKLIGKTTLPTGWATLVLRAPQQAQ